MNVVSEKTAKLISKILNYLRKISVENSKEIPKRLIWNQLIGRIESEIKLEQMQ